MLHLKLHRGAVVEGRVIFANLSWASELIAVSSIGVSMATLWPHDKPNDCDRRHSNCIHALCAEHRSFKRSCNGLLNLRTHVPLERLRQPPTLGILNGKLRLPYDGNTRPLANLLRHFWLTGCARWALWAMLHLLAPVEPRGCCSSSLWSGSFDYREAIDLGPFCTYFCKRLS